MSNCANTLNVISEEIRKCTDNTRINFLKDLAWKTFFKNKKNKESGKMEKAALEFLHLVNNNSKLTPNQLSFLDAIYENTMKGIGFPSCPTKHDPKKKRF